MSINKLMDENKEIVNEICGLEIETLYEHLQLAKKYNKGYYKNKDGEYLFVKGIEVTNNTGDLCRMGFNGETRGVWVHYCLISDTECVNTNVPVFTFDSKFDPSLTEPKKLMKSTTKRAFNRKMKSVISKMAKQYESKREVSEYLDFLDKFIELYKKEN